MPREPGARNGIEGAYAAPDQNACSIGPVSEAVGWLRVGDGATRRAA